MNPKFKQMALQPSTKYSHSRTVPGQSLVPSDLLKRHLAGTLPDIDHSSMYEYHYDEDGVQVAEPLPIEFHEFHKMALQLRKRQIEEANRLRAVQAKKFRDEVIEEYKKSILPKEPTPENITPNSPD